MSLGTGTKIKRIRKKSRKIKKEKKNMYLGRPDEKENHPSFNVYIETINEIYYNHFKGV